MAERESKGVPLGLCMAVLCLLLWPPGSVRGTPSSVDGVPFYLNPGPWERDPAGLPAAKPLAGLNAGEPRTVRMIYFLPNDRQARPDIDATFDTLIRQVQQSYAEQMENHGFGRRTFRFETDGDGRALVHHVKGEFDDGHYRTNMWDTVWEEVTELFDLTENIYLVSLDVSDAPYCGLGASWGPEGGIVVIPYDIFENEHPWACGNVAVIAHELGHTFGVAHDYFRDAVRSPSSYHTDWMVNSFAAAEWLAAHRYFNVGRSYPHRDRPTTIRMLTPSAAPPRSIRLRFEVTDSDGLHQTQLFNSTGEACDFEGVSGERATVEFVTTEVTEAPGNEVELRVVDVHGNVVSDRFSIDILPLLDPEDVSIPDANLAAVVLETLDLPLGNSVTQLDMLRVRRLQGSSRQITDLAGLEHAVNMIDLDLGGNEIHDITPLAGLIILEVLGLWYNRISDVQSLMQMNSLQRLWLSGNSVSDLSPIAGLTNLKVIRLEGNPIAEKWPLYRLLQRNRFLEIDIDTRTLGMVSGDGQEGAAGAALAEPLSILVLDRYGDPLARTEVTFAVTGGGGTLSVTTATTDDDGRASTTLALGSRPGTNTVEARVSGLEPVTFSAVGLAVLTAVVGISGDEQQGAAGAQLPEPFVVEARDQNNNPLTGVEATFAVSAGGGTLSVETATTDAHGRATTTLTLGSGPGINTVTARVGELQPVTFSATGLAIPTTLSGISGDELQGAAGAPLDEPFFVEVRDQNGNLLAGIEVAFEITSGDGMLSAATVITDDDGRASTTLTLGSRPGTNTVEASVSGLEPVTFTATGQAVPQTLAIVSGDEQQGTVGAALAEGLVVSVRDQNGDPFAGATVTFEVTSGDGMLSAATAATDEDGRASTTLTLGRDPETVTVAAAVAGLEPVTFTATAKASPDFDGDGEIGFSDFFLFAEAFGGDDPSFDLDGSGAVDFADFFLFAERFGRPERSKLLALARERLGLPEGPQLQQNAPNPFNSGTVISWFLLQPGLARLEVFALTGQRVAVLHQGPKKPGMHRVHWDGRDEQGRPLASGIYLYRLVTAGSVQTRKLTLLR